jgi:hypothetical protein
MSSYLDKVKKPSEFKKPGGTNSILGSSNDSNAPMSSGSSQFDRIKKSGGIDSILGPSYDYASHIKTPMELGMSTHGSFDALGDDVRGLLGYIDLLVTGHCNIGSCASIKGRNPDGSPGEKLEGPLGNKFFLPTAVQCKDIATGKQVTRSLYINNVPDGSIPLVSNLDSNVAFTDFEGLMPGILSNIAQIHPTQILMAFVNGSSPTCQSVLMPVIDRNNIITNQNAYLINSDIAIMPKAWFPKEKPKSSYNTKKPESFSKIIEDSTLNDDKIDYSKMPDDTLIQLYYSMLGLLGLYILLRLMLKKK